MRACTITKSNQISDASFRTLSLPLSTHCHSHERSVTERGLRWEKGWDAESGEIQKKRFAEKWNELTLETDREIIFE